MLAGLTSRWTMPAAQSASSPAATSELIWIVVGTSSGPSSLRRWSSERPSMNRCAMYGWPSCSPVTTTGTTLGCLTVWAIRASRENRRRNVSSRAKSPLTSFSATGPVGAGGGVDLAHPALAEKVVDVVFADLGPIHGSVMVAHAHSRCCFGGPVFFMNPVCRRALRVSVDNAGRRRRRADRRRRGDG